MYDQVQPGLFELFYANLARRDNVRPGTTWYESLNNGGNEEGGFAVIEQQKSPLKRGDAVNHFIPSSRRHYSNNKGQQPTIRQRRHRVRLMIGGPTNKERRDIQRNGD